IQRERLRRAIIRGDRQARRARGGHRPGRDRDGQGLAVLVLQVDLGAGEVAEALVGRDVSEPLQLRRQGEAGTGRPRAAMPGAATPGGAGAQRAREGGAGGKRDDGDEGDDQRERRRHDGDGEPEPFHRYLPPTFRGAGLGPTLSTIEGESDDLAAAPSPIGERSVTAHPCRSRRLCWPPSPGRDTFVIVWPRDGAMLEGDTGEAEWRRS